MQLRTWGALAGAAIALPIAYAIGTAAVTWAALLIWAAFCCQSSWPEMMEWVVAGVGLVAGAAVVAVGAVLGHRFGRGEEGAAREPMLRIVAPAIVVLVSAGVLALWFFQPAEPPARPSAPEVVEKRSPALTKLDAERHKLLLVQATPGDSVRVRLHSEGARAGEYRLRVQISEQVYRKVLVASDEIITLPAGVYDDQWEVESQTVGQAYAAKILNANPGDVQIEENFVVTVILEPKLTEAELAALDPGERERLANGILNLESKTRTEYLSRLLIVR